MFFRGEKDEHGRLGESSGDNKLATEVTHGGELRRSHQEQFETLRQKLQVLESETRFTTEAARELREKQKLLIGSKKYAEAFDNLKVRNLEMPSYLLFRTSALFPARLIFVGARL